MYRKWREKGKIRRRKAERERKGERGKKETVNSHFILGLGIALFI
jgi:hypothetical protein